MPDATHTWDPDRYLACAGGRGRSFVGLSTSRRVFVVAEVAR